MKLRSFLLQRAHIAFSLVALAGLGASFNLVAQAAPTDIAMRDPSTLVKRDGVYYIFGTGHGTPEYSSRDRLTWTPLGPALPQAPLWLSAAVPQNRNDSAWVPDIAFFDGEYHLYSAYSSLGSKRSAIGLATNKTLDPKGWVDQGIVVQSDDALSFNTIDPSVFQDGDGHWWMSFGSHFDGIHVMPLDDRTGKRAANSQLTRIATRPDAPGNAIEASAIYFHDGWYYLFTNWGSCLQGARSTYNIRVCRSRTATGPYEDRTGRRALEGGGSLFLGSAIDDGTGRPFDDQVAPGHAGILRDGDQYFLSTAYEWSRFLNGQTTVNVQTLAWDFAGWPRAVLDNTPFKIVSNLGTHAVLEASNASANGAVVQTDAYEGRALQKWTLKHLGDGYYSITNVASGLVIGTVGGASTPGSKVELAPFQNLDSQKWYARQNEDGTYSLLLKSSNQSVALDVQGSSLNDQTPLQVWSDLASDAQKWTFHQK